MTLDRFWSKVDIKELEGCWNWKAAKNSSGRALFDSKSAPRESYRRCFGEFPKELYVLHECDNPACVNPAHLFLGTQLDNVHDMIGKGRGSPAGDRPMRGEEHPFAKLTWDDVREIRKLSKSGVQGIELSKKFGVGPMQISRIIRNQAWTEPDSGA